MQESYSFPRWKFWLALLGAPALWLIHFLGRYLFTEARCGMRDALNRRDQIVLLVVALLFIISRLYISFFTFNLSTQPLTEENVIIKIGLLTSIFFTFVLLIETAGIFFLATC